MQNKKTPSFQTVKKLTRIFRFCQEIFDAAPSNEEAPRGFPEGFFILNRSCFRLQILHPLPGLVI
ncbi:MAG TPA: hypothetical protein PKX47_09560, partial [Smithellaceae bacterium]|nr:hypothetical protein [Smithellaceae bacterium]HOE23763.1 hypothetical protein [Smithellaceae bacterium]HOR63214.1 hypothetical protein [Smithellaceae bacterium]HOU57647.1 hypothetical protein [Smithellaceae bacterium]HPI52470.1 hypothetical protein [Smithellaceae bacterium]